MKFSRKSGCCILMAALVAATVDTARAHKVSAVSVVLEIDSVKKTFKVELAMDVDPTGDPEFDDQIPPEVAATTFATEALTLYFDDQEVSVEPEISILSESDEETPEELRRKKAMGALRGSIPEHSENFLLYVNEGTEAAVVMVVIQDGKPARRLQVLYPGEFSNPVRVLPVIAGDPFEAGAVEKGEDAVQSDGKILPDDSAADREASAGGGTGDGKVCHGSFFVRGFRAMLAGGLDHWLFVFAMILMPAKPGSLIGQMAFWLAAHVAGFSLVNSAWVVFSPAVAGSLAAFGAAFLAIDNLFGEKTGWRRWMALGVFGLFQGVVLARLCSLTSRSDGWTALAAWWGGAEAISIGFVLVLWGIFRSMAAKGWFPGRVRTPFCVIIAGISMYRGLEFFF